MKINEKIRFIREINGWSQNEMASKLNMSTSGYSSIERGETNIQYSRLEQIAKILDLKLSELTDLDDRNFQIYLACDGSNNYGNYDGIHNYGNNASINPSDQQVELKHKLEIAQLKIEQQQKEILYVKEEVTNLKAIIELMKKND
ncbi:MAG: helix-turn-helix transcriptional regulator [Candidatus Marithrix sp.]